jgi:hypothetical protein
MPERLEGSEESVETTTSRMNPMTMVRVGKQKALIMTGSMGTPPQSALGTRRNVGHLNAGGKGVGRK